MTQKVWIKLQDGNERTYEGVTNVHESQRSWTIYGADNAVLAVIDKYDLKNLLTEPDDNPAQ